jgi:3-methylcrotonyl-CoA carboxylase alpha subunit
VGIAQQLGTVMGKVITLRSADGEHRVETDGDRITVDGVETPLPGRAWAVVRGDARWVFLDGEVFQFEAQHRGGRRPTTQQGSLAAPMPATVIRVLATPGQAVTRGDTLIVLEAMKMELPVRAAADGVVKAIHCREGQLVQPGVPLVEMNP